MKRCIFLFLLCSMFFLSSCGYKDIDKRYFVVSIGVDKGRNDMYDISLKLAVPSSDIKTGSNESEILTESAQTISEAVRIIKAKVDKELDFGHAKMIIFGDELVKEDITNIVDWFSRRRDIQAIAWTAIGRPSALKILEAKPMGERLPSNSLFLTFGNAGTETPYISSVYLYKLMSLKSERGIDPILPIIEADDQDYSTNQLAVFSSLKHALTLDDEQTKYFNIIKNNSSKTEVKVEGENNAPYFVFSTDKVRTTYRIEEKNTKVNILMNIKISGVVEEAFDVLQDEKKREYEKDIELEVSDHIKNLLKLFQKENVDPVGFGLRYRGLHTGNESTKINEWNSIYKSVNFKVTTQVEMKNVGIIKDQDGYPE
ncbi:Ger(x)C family spore germination protein [Metabacillus schmidteae]|uniref:Ger(x)C family spore germination protein n=1 Tax=Metabacillus schmidteae TaxID=2730405 RepID=UPI0022A77870|nr:Ger(x)C family spore germination protein [Metabacillus schmidteae]